VSQSDFVTRGQALVNAGQFQEAVKVCRLGLLGRPTTVEGRIVLGQALLALKRFDEVLAEMRVALELDHGSVAAQALKGEALLRKGDPHAAVDVLQKVRAITPTDPRIAQLLAEAERVTGKPKFISSSSVSFIGGMSPALDDSFSVEGQTKHYPSGADQEDTGNDGHEDTGGSYTRPTSLSAPAARRSQPQQAMPPDGAPPPASLSVGDRSGTLEVDPEAEGVEVGADELGDVAAPPAVRAGAARAGGAPRARGGKRADPEQGRSAPGAAMSKQSPDRAAEIAARKAARAKGEISSVELADDEIMELDEAIPPPGAARLPGPFTAVRNAVNRPSGPMQDPPPNAPPPSLASLRPTAHQPSQPPPHLAQLIASQPHVMQMSPVPAQPPQPFNARSAIAAALPTQAAIPMPQPPSGIAAAARATVVADPRYPGAGPGLPAGPPASPAGWAPPDARTVAPWGNTPPAASPPMPMPMPIAAPDRGGGMMDAHLAALSDPTGSGVAVAINESSQTGGKVLKTGMRRTRSRLQIAMWVILGVAMIGGGVFAGFQIRAMRLGKQIDAARGEAATLASTDTWQGWVGARSRLADVAEASPTLDNRAMLARTRAILAYEFGDGLAEAQAAVDELAGQGGLEGEVAAAFVALARNDAKAARAAADRALGLASDDAAALYASSQAALLAGELAPAADAGKKALEKEARAMYATGLARVHAAATSWEAGVAATDQALKATPEHPGALIVRGVLFAESGRVASGNAPGAELRAALEKVVREGTRPATEQPRGVSPAQVAYADLALARVDAARGNLDAVKADMANAFAVGLDEQRFAEEVVETLYSINLLAQCRTATDRALAAWPGSLRVRAVRAQLAIAQGRPDEALALLDKAKDLMQLPGGLALRGAARLASGDLDGARADLDEALKRAPQLEHAVIGRAWVELRANKLAEARKRLEALYKAGAPASPALAAAYGRVLLAAGDPVLARGALEKAAGAVALIEASRAQLDFARVQLDLGEMKGARQALEQAIRIGIPEAPLALALLEFEDRRPAEGHKAIEALVQEAGDGAPAALLLEAARARMLVGDHRAAAAALERLQKLQDVVAWRLDRERGRYALRRGDNNGAAQALSRALDSCGDDAETFLLAAEVASADIKQARLVEKVQRLAKLRLKGRPEEAIIAGKLALAEDRNEDAEVAYEAARGPLEKASPRRQAQVEFGRAVVAYNKRDDAAAKSALKLVIALDPTLYNAYLYYGELLREQAPEEAFELSKKAVAYNPDHVDGWVMYGTLAHLLRKRADLSVAITRVGSLAPGGEALRQLQGLR
jgi:predicted Zn-dependent protease